MCQNGNKLSKKGCKTTQKALYYNYSKRQDKTKGSKKMKDYIVEFIGSKGNRNRKQFDTEKLAMNFYYKCNGEAIVKKYNAESFEYEVIKGVK